MDEVTVLLFDPHKLSRECFRLVLRGTEFSLSDEAENLVELSEALYQAEADLVVINLRGRLDELASSVRTVRELSSYTRIIVVGEVKIATRLEEMGGAGADGYVLQDYSAEGLVDSLRRVHYGEKVYPPATAPGVEAMRVRGLSENDIEKLVKILVRRYGLGAKGRVSEESAPHSLEAPDHDEYGLHVGDWEQILSAIQSIKGEPTPGYRH